jgi:D-alanine--poly(phosphoribitol) ligase subunit 1
MIHPVDRFLASAFRYPDSTAISTPQRNWTYAELEGRVRSLARSFCQPAGARILIALPPSADTYAAILASMLVGGTHTPVNVGSPVSKLQKIAASLEPDIIVAEDNLAAMLLSAAPSARTIDPATVTDDLRLEGDGARNGRAYIMFTSGSTGTPKGVVVSASALATYVDWLASLGYGPSDRVSQQPNLGFDISMTDIFGALCHGAVLIPVATEADRLTAARFIKREKITVWNSTPSVVGLMMTARQLKAENLASLRLINFCGEPLSGEILDGIFAALPSARVQNTYGPTEATVAVTCQSLGQQDYRENARASAALGDPLPGMQLHLLGGTHPDEGEIVICGPQLAEGYWRDPEKTARAFRDIDLDGKTVRAYFTGDWAERHANRTYFRERIDFQVKVRGHRVELDEVTAALRSCGWPVACAFKRGEVLAAVVETADNDGFDEARLRLQLNLLLDKYAVPERIFAVARIPRNENDKIDRKACAELFERIRGDARS